MADDVETPRGPERLWLIRHGQSAGNVARDTAELHGLDAIALSTRDIDVDLTPLGVHQAEAVADWLAGPEAPLPPTVVVASPYRRTIRTAEILVARLPRLRLPRPISDERLREREFGILDHLTRTGIEAQHPDQAQRLTALGKFYHRPPGGESWCDVILRLRSWFDTLCREFPDERVAVITHGVVVLCLRYLLERLDEAALLRIDAESQLANCGITAYARSSGSFMPGGLEPACFNHIAPLARSGEPVTTTPDLPRQAAP